MRAALPPNETSRAAALHACGILDTPPEPAYDAITTLAASLLEAPLALVSLVDSERQWFKSRHGTAIFQTPRDISFCAHAILAPEDVTVAANMSGDTRFVDNPLVTGSTGLRFYAGAPLLSRERLPLGTLCVLDGKPRKFTPRQKRLLRTLSHHAMSHLEAGRTRTQLAAENALLRQDVLDLRQENAILQDSNRLLHDLSTTDALTGLKNHRAFQESLHAEWARATRYTMPLSLIVLDVDLFKHYNDAFGHPAGDEVLRQVGMLLASTARESDIVARYGGEEFAIILPGTDAFAAGAAAQRMRRAIEAYDWPRRPITASLGVATSRLLTVNRHSLLEQADAAMYQAKRAGRNRVMQVHFSSGSPDT